MNEKKGGASHASPAPDLGSAMQGLACGHIIIQCQKVTIPGLLFSHKLKADFFSPQTGEQIQGNARGCRSSQDPRARLGF